MKRRNIILFTWLSLLIFLLDGIYPDLSQAKPFFHKETYGKWTEKVSSDGSQELLYVILTKEYGSPDANGIVYDRVTIVIMEPPAGHDSYAEFEKFMSPNSVPSSQGFQIQADPVTSSTFMIGAFPAKVLRGTGTLKTMDGSISDSKLLGKGYYLTIQERIIEVLVQVQTVYGDIQKIEDEIDDLVTSFRFGQPEDLLIIRAIKGIPFQTEKSITPLEPIKITKKAFPWSWFFVIFFLIVLLLVGYVYYKKRRPLKKQKSKKKMKNKVLN